MNNDKINGFRNNENGMNPPDFIITESSEILLKSIEEQLAGLAGSADLNPIDDEFYYKFRNIYDLYDRLQNEVLNSSGINIACSSGCANCCFHWVEDVNFFEGLIIRRYLKENHPDIIDFVQSSFKEDAEVLQSLGKLVDEKITECSSMAEDYDSYDLLLSCFYQLERPCALLDMDGRCIIYPVRPFTCRDYFNINNSGLCLPERINEEENATLIISISEEIMEYLEILHMRFKNGNDNMSLRSLLAELL